MPALRLARIAAEAEGLRLRRYARRRAIQAAMGGVAALFLLAAFAVLHFLIWFALAKSLGPVSSTAILLGIDIVIALIFGLLASRSSPGRIEREAMHVRDQARQQLAITAATATTLAPIARMLGLRHVSGLVIGALASRYLARH